MCSCFTFIHQSTINFCHLQHLLCSAQTTGVNKQLFRVSGHIGSMRCWSVLIVSTELSFASQYVCNISQGQNTFTFFVLLGLMQSMISPSTLNHVTFMRQQSSVVMPFLHSPCLFVIFSSLSTGSFDDSASEHSSVGTVSTTTPSASSGGPYGTFSPLTAADNYSTTTTDSENDMFECSSNNNNNTSRNGNGSGRGSIDSSNSSSSTSIPR